MKRSYFAAISNGLNLSRIFFPRVFLILSWLLLLIPLSSPDSVRAADPTQLMVRVTIERVRGLDNMEGPFGGDPDFYAVVNIDGEEFDNKVNSIEDDNDISPNWQFFILVDSARTNVPLTIDIYDEDGGLRGDDDHVDIDPHSGRTLELSVNLDPCAVSGDVISNCDVTIVSAGAQSDRAEIRFKIEVGPANPVKVKTIIERVRGLDNMEGPFGGDPDFYAVVSVDGQEFDNKANAIEDNNDIRPNWEFSKTVDFNKGSIPITIDIYDEDGGLRGDDDHVDVKPGSGRKLRLSLDMSACLTGSTSAVSGDVTGACQTTIIVEGNGDDRAMLWFRIEVEPPPTTPGTNVLCLHDPIWPQGGEAVTISAEALDGALNPKSTNIDIEIWLNSNTAPYTTASNMSSLTTPIGSFPAGSSFTYGCLIRDKTRGETVWSGWRKVQIGLPPSGQAVPILFTGPRSSRIDTVFIADVDTYTSAFDSNLLGDISNIIKNDYYAEKVFLTHQDDMNFWIALDRGNAKDDCESEVPDNWDNDYTFADTGAILHRDSSIRDCNPGGERYFSSEVFPSINSTRRVILHETGHSPFGLADEYCDQRPGSMSTTCDGGYFQNDPFPNVYEEPEDCIADIPALQVWDDRLGHPRRTTSDCQEFTEVIDWWFDSDWSVSDPPSSDLMVDNRIPRGADARRIDWLFNRCASANCGPTLAVQSAFPATVGDPRVDPMPVFDFDDGSKSMVVRLDFDTRETVQFDSAKVVYGQPYTTLGDPPLLRIKLFDANNNLVEEHNAWHPMWQFIWQDGHESRQISEGQSGRFIFPFSSNLDRMEVVDIPLDRTVISVDLGPAIDLFCAENPQDMDCVTDLALTMGDSPDPVVAGTILTYSLTVVNDGQVAATGVTLVDMLPPGLTFNPTASDPSCEAVINTITCDINSLGDGESTNVVLAASVDPAIEDGTVIINTATVTANQADIDPSNNTAIESTTVIRRTDLAVVKTSEQAQVNTGDILTYIINVTNNGPSLASGVIMTDTLPAGVSFDAVTSSHGSGCSLSGSIINCDLDTLTVGENATVTVRTIVGCNAAELTNVVAIAGNETDPFEDNNTDSHTAALLADYGDAIDPPYSSQLANNGAYHCDASMEWLGIGVTYESDSLSADSFDDGVNLHPSRHQSPILARITVHTTGLGVSRYGTEATNRLYLRGWFDMNGDGDWDDPGELVIDCIIAPGTMGTCNGRPANWPNRPSHSFSVRLLGGPPKHWTGWLRFRLSYGAPVGPTGPSLYGEVEDYWPLNTTLDPR